MFDILMNKVCETCEVHSDLLINGSKLQAIVDARLLLVQYLRRVGLSSDDIALIVLRKRADDIGLMPPLSDIKMKAKNIDRLFSMYSDRCMQSYAFCLMSTEIRDFCVETYKGVYMVGMKELPR